MSNEKIITNVLVRGQGASKGIKEGIVRTFIKHNEKTIYSDGVEIDDGDIVVIPFVTPLDFQYIINAGAVVTDIGGVTSHAACIARELGIPCIVATENATSVLKEGMEVIVDGENGIVYQ
jgi:pyruvate, water dikinase